MRMMLFAIVTAVAAVSVAAPPADRNVQTPGSRYVDNDTYVNANNILMFVTNHGSYGRDLSGVFGRDAGTFFPYVSIESIQDGTLDDYVLYAAGLWIGGKVDGQTRVTIAEYNDEYVPGPMENGTYMPDRPEFRVYKLYRDSLESYPNQDYLEWPVGQGAPVDVGGRPLMRGDQMAWAAFNDADAAQHSNDAGSTAPLGIEVRQTWWVWDSEPTGDITYVGDPVEVTTSGPSMARVTVVVAEVSGLTGHAYEITLSDTPDGPLWHLTDVTVGMPVLSDQLPAQSELDWVVVDGMAINVLCSGSGFLSFECVASGAGPLDPPESGAAPWVGFPCPTVVEPDGYPTDAQQVGQGLWLIHTADNGGTGGGGTRFDYCAFIARVTRDGAQNEAIGDSDYEIRFTGSNDNPGVGGSHAIEWYYDYNVFWVPFELWNIGVDTPDDPSDDYRMVPFIVDDGDDDVFSLESWGGPDLGGGDYEHSVSGLLNDPFTDWIYWFKPTDSTPGTAGYDAAEAAMLAGTLPDEAGALLADEVMSRMVLVNWNGDTATTDETAGRYNQDCPEQGTVFRIRTGKAFGGTVFSFQPEPPIAVETGGEGNAIYIAYELRNKGGNTINDCYVALWADPDLGNHTDDLVGCDTLADVFYTYNGSPVDAHYGGRCPAVGFKVVHGPLVPSAGDTAMFADQRVSGYRNLGMTAFSKYINGTDPNSYFEAYNYMRGLMADGMPYEYNGQPVTYVHSGDPVTGTGDLDFAPSDRRMMASCGPFTLLPGESQYMLLKLGVGQGTDRLSSITRLKAVLNGRPQFMCGDIDDSGWGPDIVDLFYLVRYMFKQGPPPPIPDAADVWPGGGLDIVDLTYLVNFMFKEGPDLQCP